MKYQPTPFELFLKLYANKQVAHTNEVIVEISPTCGTVPRTFSSKRD